MNLSGIEICEAIRRVSQKRHGRRVAKGLTEQESAILAVKDLRALRDRWIGNPGIVSFIDALIKTYSYEF